MPKWYVWYWVMHGCLTAALITLKLLKVGSRRRGVVKMLASCSFFAASIYGAVLRGDGFSVLLAVGLFFAVMGDLLLIFRHIAKCFRWAVIFFCVASATLSVYSVLAYGWVWWSVVPYVIFLIANVLAQKYKIYSYGRNKFWLNVYAAAVGCCGCLGLTLFCAGTASLPMFLFGLGCFLYFVSDVFLGFYLFKFRNRLVDATNSVLYFPGMLLIAVSLWF